MNASVAGFGEEYRVCKDDKGETVVVKVAKVESICPLDKLTMLTRARAKQ